MLKFITTFQYAYLSLAAMMALGGALLWIISNKLRKEDIRLLPLGLKVSSEFVLGAIGLIVLALLSKIIGYPRIGIKIGLLAILFYFLFSFIKVHYKSSKLNSIFFSGFRWFYSRLLIAALPGIILCFIFSTQFSKLELERLTDPWQVTIKFRVYPNIDHHLQWLIADNIYKRKHLETNFNRDRNQLWSAGDRPIILGFLNAIFSRLLDVHQLLDYFYRTILFSSFFWIGLFSFLRVEFQRLSSKSLTLILLPIMTSPFFVANLIYTWPKMLGLSFGMMGMAISIFALRNTFSNKIFLYLISGVSFALGTISHTAAIFCLFATFVYVLLNQILGRTKISFASMKAGFISIVIPFVVITQIHSFYLKSYTYQTNLLARVQICRDGSYLYPTPPKPLLQACTEYIDRVGLYGAIEDRIASLKRALFYGIPQFFELLTNTTVSNYGENLLRKLDEYYQSCLFISNGFFLIPFFLISLLSLARIHKIKELDVYSEKLRCNLILQVGIVCLLAFSSLLAEWSEMSPHVLPYIVPLFVFAGSLLIIWNQSYKLLLIFSLFLVTVHSLVFIYRLPLDVVFDPFNYTLSFILYLVAFVISLNLINKNSDNSPSKEIT